jgi:hypothetical protein
LRQQPTSDVYFFVKPELPVRGITSVFRHAGFNEAQLVMRTCWSEDQHESRAMLQTVMGCVDDKALDRGLLNTVKPGLIDVSIRQDRAANRILREFGIGGRPFVMVQMGNRKTMNAFRSSSRASNRKHWPQANWVRVIDGLLQTRPSLAVLLCGAKSEWRYLEKTRRKLRSRRVVNLAHDLPLGALKGLSTRADCLVSVDTGTAHLAAVLGCPSVVLFGPANPRRYRPLSLGNPVRCLAKYEAGCENPDIRLIRPEDVLQATCHLLAESENASRGLPSRGDLAPLADDAHRQLRQAV